MPYTITKDLVLPSTVTGSWPRPRWFDMSMWAKPLDTCMLDIRFREKFQDALAVVISDEERAGLDILTHGDYHCDEDFGGRSWHHYPLQRWKGFDGDYLQSEETRSPWLRYPPGTLLNEIYTGWRWPRVTDTIEHRPLDYAKIWRIAQGRTRKPVRFGTCCSQVMGLFLDIHTNKYKDNRQVVWDMAVAMNKELLALRDAGCRCIQIEEPTLHFMANTFGAESEQVKFMVECYNREVQGLDDVEIWIHTCWGNPNMQRVMEDTSYRASFELYLHALRGDVWTIETKDRGFQDIELFGALKGRLPKKICIGAVSHRSLQADRAEDVASSIRTALQHIAPEQLIVSSDCGFGRQGCNREIAFFKATAIAQGCNIVRKELGLETTYVPAADPQLQTDIVPKTEPMKPHTVFLGELTNPEVEAFLKQHHTVIVPTGATEQHGPHGPLATDVLIPQEIARRIAPTIHALVAPPISYALSYPHAGFTGLVQIRIPTFMALVEDLCVSFATMGFKRIIFLNGHYDNTYAIAYACANAAERIGKDVKAFPVNYWDGLTAADVDEWSGLKNGLHANRAETSAVLAINPTLVDMDKANAEFPPFPDYTIGNTGAVHTAFFFTAPGSVYWATKSGTWGDARQSTAEAGERYLEAGVRSTLLVLDNIEKTFAAMPPR